jgi:hypothetical protein
MRKWFDLDSRMPSPAVNRMPTAVFSAESPIGHIIPFPWGTSIDE